MTADDAQLDAALVDYLAAVVASIDKANALRDQIIRRLRADGVPLRTIAEAAGITHTGVAKIAARAPR